MATERYLSTQEVAERLAVDEQTVRRWIKSGKLEAFKVGKSWRIPPAAFNELIENAARRGTEAPLINARVRAIAQPVAGANPRLDELIGYTLRVARWGQRVAGEVGGVSSAELRHAHEALFEAFGEGFDVYHHNAGSEAGEALAAVLEQLVESMAEVEDALGDEERREADPRQRAEVHDLVAHPRSAALREELHRAAS